MAARAAWETPPVASQRHTWLAAAAKPLRRWRSARSRSHKPSVYIGARWMTVEERRITGRSVPDPQPGGGAHARSSVYVGGLPRGRGTIRAKRGHYNSTSPSPRDGQRPPRWRTTACRRRWPAVAESEQQRKVKRSMIGHTSLSSSLYWSRSLVERMNATPAKVVHISSLPKKLLVYGRE